MDILNLLLVFADSAFFYLLRFYLLIRLLRLLYKEPDISSSSLARRPLLVRPVTAVRRKPLHDFVFPFLTIHTRIYT